MIISASYKTDIPAFYGQWLMNRIKAGYCKMINPFNRQVSRVSLLPDAVDGFVFWTKNIGPFFNHLTEVKERGYPFIVQYTINGYPRTLEFSVVNYSRSVEHMKYVAGTFGPKVAIWRYDTIVFSSVTPVDFHLRNFENLAAALEGTTDEVVISFAQIYRKTLRNMDWAADKFGFSWEDPDDEIKFNLAADLAQIAKAHNMKLTVCSQAKYLAPGTTEARCVDAERLDAISERPIISKIQGNRPECGCYASRDIGEYDTCPHGCVYCYAVLNRELAQSRYKNHDPQDEFLFRPSGPLKEGKEEPVQLKLM